MLIDVYIPHQTIKKPAIVYWEAADQRFPIFSIGTGSYIEDGGVLNTGLDVTLSKGFGIHNLHIGNYVSIAINSQFCMGINHNWKNLAMGHLLSLWDDLVSGEAEECQSSFHHKGQILIQNDVWLGNGVTVMPGVTIHNGAVVAAESHVVKDVPPYAIVGGNPAKVIKYRFPDEIIKMLLEIKWWNWDIDIIRKHRKWFYSENVEAFCAEFYPKILAQKPRFSVADASHLKMEVSRGKSIYLYFLDLDSEYSLWMFVMKKFLRYYAHDNNLLVLVADSHKDISPVKHFLSKEIPSSCQSAYKIIENPQNEQKLFSIADYFIANRDIRTIRWSEYCEEYEVKILSGCDLNGF